MNQTITYDFGQVLQSVAGAGLFQNGLATISKRGETGGDPNTDATGWPDIVDWTPIVGLQNIPCMLAVFRLKPDMAGVERLEDRMNTLAERTCLLDGYFPQIVQKYIATVTIVATGTVVEFEIMSAESDSQATFTRLALRSFVR